MKLRGHFHKSIRGAYSICTTLLTEYSFFFDRTFVFLVGPDKRLATVHVSTLKNISKPLTYMMTNSMMNEALSGVAELPDIDPKIFALLLDFAYTGGYKAACAAEERNVSVELTQPSYFCQKCLDKTPVSEKELPYCSSMCKSNSEWTEPIQKSCLVCCVAEPSVKPGGCAYLICASCHSSGKHEQLLAERKRWTHRLNVREFHYRNYPALGLSHKELQDHLLTLRPVDLPTPEFSIHSKLYVVADKYMIEPLKALCLHKLQRDLGSFELDSNTVKELSVLLLHTYEHTSNNNGAVLRYGSRLRELVVGFAGAHCEKLVEYEDFNDMLRCGGQIVIDLAFAMTKRFKE